MRRMYSLIQSLLLSVIIVTSPVGMADLAPVESVSTADAGPMPDYRATVTNAQTAADAQAVPAPTQGNASTAAPNDPNTSNAAIATPENTAPASPPDMSSQNMSADARIARLEQQTANMAQMNLPQQISELRQEIQQLNGRLQVQQHAIQVLSKQQKSFYQDLNQRIGEGTAPQSVKNNNATPPVTSGASSANRDDSKAYRQAFNLLTKKQYPAAVRSFRTYLDNYPRGAFVANAYYWLGEMYLKQNKVKKSEKSFATILRQFPKSNKAPDAKFKLALIHVNGGAREKGRRELQAIKRQYPGSTAAQLASIQLQRME